MKITVDLYRSNYAKFAQKLIELKRRGLMGVEVGFPEDETHYSGMSMAELARLLSRGFTTTAPNSGVPVKVPARPFIRQFLEQRGDEVKYLVRNLFQAYLAGGGGSIDDVWAEIGGAVSLMMKEFAYSGGVSPGNAPYTIRKKGFDKPYVHHLDLIGSIKFWTKG